MKKARGFTLIELLVVIAIIGILASIVLVSLRSSRDLAHVGAGKTFDSNIHNGLGDAIIGEWLFNECAGATAKDSTGSGNDLSLTQISWSTDVPYGSGCSYATGSSYGIGPANLVSSNVITMAAWIKFKDLNNYQSIFSIYTSDANSMELGVNNNTHTLFGGNYNGRASAAGSAVTVGQWYYVALVSDGTATSIYINGVKSGTSGGTNFSIFSPSLGVGGRSNGFFLFNGYLDDFRIYGRALSAAEMHTIYAEGAAAHGLALEGSR